jgi:hypothetical protein
MLAHLSYKRDEFIEKGQHGWEVAKMLKLMLEQLEIFFRTLSSAAARAWFPTSDWIADSIAKADYVLRSAVPGPNRSGSHSTPATERDYG